MNTAIVLSAECYRALSQLLEKYPFFELREAVLLSRVDPRFFNALPNQTFSGVLSLSQMVHELIEHLGRHGLLESGSESACLLFQALLRVRPGLYFELRDVAAGFFAVQLAPIDPDMDVPERPRLSHEQLEGSQRTRLVVQLDQLLVHRSKLAETSRESERLRLEITALARELHATGGVRRGQLVAGTLLEEVLGSGTFGTVWRAQATVSGVTVATKVFHLDKLGQGLMLPRFRRSIQMLRALSEDPGCPPSINRIRDVSDDGLAFSMDYAHCGTLETMRRFKWSIVEILEKFRTICEACHFAHEKGIVHRDIKPGNILLNEDLQPLLIDFDISDALNSRVDSLGASTQGSLGTPVFGAPEQLAAARNASRQSDVFSLGRLLHFMLLGGLSPGMLTEHEPDLEDLSAVPLPIVEIVRKATRYDPRRRPASVRVMIQQIDRCHTGWAAIRARAQLARRWLKRNGTPLGALFLSLAVVAAVLQHIDQLEHQRLWGIVAETTKHCLDRALVDGRAGVEAELESTHERRVYYETLTPDETRVEALARLAARRTLLEQTMQTFAILEASNFGAGDGYGDLLSSLAALPDWRAALAPLPPILAPGPPPECTQDVVADCPVVPMGTGGRPGKKPGKLGLAAAPPLLTKEIPPTILADIRAQCAGKAWPMLSFTLGVRKQGDRVDAQQHDPAASHPAITCAIQTIDARTFDLSKIDENTRFVWPVTLENPDAPVNYVKAYRKMDGHQQSSRKLAANAAKAPGDGARLAFEKAHGEAVLSARDAMGIARAARSARSLHWRADYALLAMHAIQEYEHADKYKDEAMRRIAELKTRTPGCSRDRDDAWKVADDASKLLSGTEWVQYFVKRAREHASFKDFERRCVADER